LGGERRHVAGNHFAKQTDALGLYFWLHALVDVMSKPLTEPPLNFEIGYADEDYFCCYGDAAGISAWGITASIDIIGVAASVMNRTIKWLDLRQNWTNDEP